VDRERIRAIANKYLPTLSKDKENNIVRLMGCSNIWKVWQLKIPAKTHEGRVK
jgi:hypothetical protein